MGNVRAPIPPPNLPDNEVLMEDMSLYAEKIDLQGMMQEYLRRYDACDILNPTLEKDDRIMSIQVQLTSTAQHNTSIVPYCTAQYQYT